MADLPMRSRSMTCPDMAASTASKLPRPVPSDVGSEHIQTCGEAVTDQPSTMACDRNRSTSDEVTGTRGHNGDAGQTGKADQEFDIDKDAESNSVDPATADGPPDEVQFEQKKKKRKKKAKKDGLRKGVTGFEEGYAEGPITPAEAEHEKTVLYDPSRPFSSRIEECIQRYRARRRLSSERADLFNKYLSLGGVDTGPRQFQGTATDKDALAEADAEGIREMTATDHVGTGGARYYREFDAEHWEVDFEGIVKGFMSNTIPRVYGYDEQKIQLAADTIKNFLNYVLLHEVCPEYRDNIMAARTICDIAPVELRSLHSLYQELPGDFNLAAKGLFCEGRAHDLTDDANYDMAVRFRMTVLTASKNSSFIREDPEILADLASAFRVVETWTRAYKVVDIDRPRLREKEMIASQLEAAGFKNKAKPAGRLVLEPSAIEHGYSNMPRPEEEEQLARRRPREVFLIEDEILSKMERGMKMEVIACRIGLANKDDNGDVVAAHGDADSSGGSGQDIRFIVEVLNLRPSFDTFLPQELMTGWKEPMVNERPAPSVDDVDVDVDGGGGGDLDGFDD